MFCPHCQLQVNAERRSFKEIDTSGEKVIEYSVTEYVCTRCDKAIETERQALLRDVAPGSNEASKDIFYMVLTSTTPNGLADELNHCAAQGWNLQGGIAGIGSVYAAIVTRRRE